MTLGEACLRSLWGKSPGSVENPAGAAWYPTPPFSDAGARQLRDVRHTASTIHAQTNHDCRAGDHPRREPGDSGERVAFPGNNQGYEPVQPIAFSHKLHAGEMQISCVYCHVGAETSRYAGIPALNICMNCHEKVTASFAAQQQTRRRGVAGAAETVRRAGPRRRVGANRGAVAEAHRVAKGPSVARLRVLRPSRTHHGGGAVPARVTVPSKRWSACGSSKRWPWGGA